MPSSNTNADLNSQFGDTTVQPRRYEDSDSDYTGVVVVASAWLLFYALSFSSVVFKQGKELLASLFQVIS
jgi:hypothetical protein